MADQRSIPFRITWRPSPSEAPGIYCSQCRLQNFEDAIRNLRYQTPPEAPLKNKYIPETESDSESQSPLLQPPAKIFSNWKLVFHKTYKGQVLLTYVDTGVYDGGSYEYY
jgi:hypothetical protein